jgi:Rod binding domain-containing protein
MTGLAPVIGQGGTSTDDARVRSAVHAAREFEAVLLNTVLGALEKSFSSLPGKDPDASADNYQSLGMQALATGLAARGGVGIAKMITHSLLRTEGHGVGGPAVPPKALLPYADKSD